MQHIDFIHKYNNTKPLQDPKVGQVVAFLNKSMVEDTCVIMECYQGIIMGISIYNGKIYVINYKHHILFKIDNLSKQFNLADLKQKFHDDFKWTEVHKL
jgi:hypothetical protein